jgi:prolipoprotein diacylglyceryl transferase
VIASFPSPSSGILKIGPLSLHAYGLVIATGMAAAVWMTSKRWAKQGGDPNVVGQIATWAIPAGVIGARIYHVITDWSSFNGRRGDVFKIWEGGLGIWGGIILGTLVGLLVTKIKKLPLGPMMAAAAPAIPLAQAIGRWGNWFNQELFGRPSTLPWAVEIAKTERPKAYKNFETFEPTFLYESVWNLLVVGLVLFVEKRFGERLKPGRLFAVYVAGYCLGRLVIEQRRTDTATMLLGLRINTFVAAGFLLCALITLVTGIRKPEDTRPEATFDQTIDQTVANPAQ